MAALLTDSSIGRATAFGAVCWGFETLSVIQILADSVALHTQSFEILLSRTVRLGYGHPHVKEALIYWSIRDD